MHVPSNGERATGYRSTEKKHRFFGDTCRPWASHIGPARLEETGAEGKTMPRSVFGPDKGVFGEDIARVKATAHSGDEMSATPCWLGHCRLLLVAPRSRLCEMLVPARKSLR